MFTSITKDPIGYIPPLSVSSGGGSATTGSATFIYNALTDPGSPEFTQAVTEARMRIFGAADFTLDVDSRITLKPADVGYTQSVDDPLRLAIYGESDFTRSVDGIRFSINDILPTDDIYLDEGSSGTNFGSADTILAKTAGALGGDEQVAYIMWDFSDKTGFTVDTAVAEITALTTAALAETSDVTIYTHPTMPFDEDTDDWDSAEQPTGTLRQTISVDWDTIYARETLSFDATTRANMPGNWVYARIVGASLLGLSTIQIRSKEFAASEDRPILDITASAT